MGVYGFAILAELKKQPPKFEGFSLVVKIIGPQLLTRKWGVFPTDAGLTGIGLFDKLNIEERETWTAELWRLCGNARDKDFGGPVSGHSVKS